MNHWLTTHWPPRIDDDPNDIATGVWLPNGREEAGSDLKKGDRVLIYQAKTGRPEVRKRPDGSEFIVPSIKGKEGIIAVCEAECEIFEYEGAEPSKYVDGSVIWWRWHAPVELLSKSGFVPREKMNVILGYKPDYNLRGFGDFHSGLKKITEDQFNSLLKIFKNKIRTLPHKPALRIGGNGLRGGKGGESQEHFQLKIYVAYNASAILKDGNISIFQIEYPFPSGDRADILLEDAFGKILGVEIEVNVYDDQIEGLLQAIKYRYMSELMTSRRLGDSRALLIAYTISKKMKILCKEYDIHCLEVDKEVVKQWTLSEEGKSKLAEHSLQADEE